jgi:hypothetical protein
MATAKKTDETYKVKLTLTKAEAETLHIILGLVGGNPVNSPRKYADSIQEALDKIGVTNSVSMEYGSNGLDRTNGDITFYEDPNLIQSYS